MHMFSLMQLPLCLPLCLHVWRWPRNCMQLQVSDVFHVIQSSLTSLRTPETQTDTIQGHSNRQTPQSQPERHPNPIQTDTTIPGRQTPQSQADRHHNPRRIDTSLHFFNDLFIIHLYDQKIEYNCFVLEWMTIC